MADPGRLNIDPHSLVCPDYTADRYANERADIERTNPGVDAVEHLKNLWKFLNDAERRRWNDEAPQRQEEERILQEERQRQEEERQREEEERAAQEENARREAEPRRQQQEHDSAAGVSSRSSRSSLPKFEFTPGKSSGPITSRIGEYARHRLKNRSYVELWYFTKSGREATKGVGNTSLSEGYTIVSSGDAVQLKPTNQSRAHKDAVPDELLPWSDVMEASAVFLREIEAASWPKKVIEAFTNFFYTLSQLPVHMEDEGSRIVAQYQADYRKRWHDVADSEDSDSLFDISSFDQVVFRTSERLVHERRRRELVQSEKELMSRVR